jgi:hypothetical protein
MKAVDCRLWAVGRSTVRVRRDSFSNAADRSIWRVEFAEPTHYSLRIKAAASPFLARAYSLEPTALRTEVTP